MIWFRRRKADYCKRKWKPLCRISKHVLLFLLFEDNFFCLLLLQNDTWNLFQIDNFMDDASVFVYIGFHFTTTTGFFTGFAWINKAKKTCIQAKKTWKLSLLRSRLRYVIQCVNAVSFAHCFPLKMLESLDCDHLNWKFPFGGDDVTWSHFVCLTSSLPKYLRVVHSTELFQSLSRGLGGQSWKSCGSQCRNFCFSRNGLILFGGDEIVQGKANIGHGALAGPMDA